VNHHVAAVDQHPVGSGQALDADMAETAMLHALGQLLRHGGDLAGRTARSDHHVIGNRGLAFERDRDDLLRLIVIERVQHQFASEPGSEAGSGAGAPRGGRGLGDRLVHI
jgi:hypothetical protein